MGCNTAIYLFLLYASLQLLVTSKLDLQAVCSCSVVMYREIIEGVCQLSSFNSKVTDTRIRDLRPGGDLS